MIVPGNRRRAPSPEVKSRKNQLFKDENYYHPPLSIPEGIFVDEKTYSNECDSDSESDSDHDEEVHVADGKERAPQESESDDEDEDEDEDEDDDYVDRTQQFNVMASLQYEYLFTRELFRGERSVVWSAIQKESGFEVAIKIARANPHRDPIEVRVMSKIVNVPHCQKLIKFYRIEELVAVVSHLCREKDDDGKIPAEDAKVLMRHVLIALSGIHERGILYRDVKPSNVMWDEKKKSATLVDFDLATFDSRAHDMYRGTEGYEAPEVVAENAYGKSADIYSAGVLMVQLHFNDPPEREVTECDVTNGLVRKWKKAIRNKIKKGKAEPWMPVAISMLEYEAEKRPTAKALLQNPYFSSSPS